VKLIFSGTLFIVGECSDNRFMIAVKWRPARDSLIWKIRNAATNSMAYDTIPCASEQGIYCGLAGN